MKLFLFFHASWLILAIAFNKSYLTDKRYSLVIAWLCCVVFYEHIFGFRIESNYLVVFD